MKARIQTLKTEIKTLTNVIDTLQGAMLNQAIEELKNRRFEMEMLMRNLDKANIKPVALKAPVNHILMEI